MTKQEIINTIIQIFQTTKGNLISKDNGYEGEPFLIYDEPIVGFSSADDALYEKLKEPGVIGSHFKKPSEWMENAQTVVSIFFPFSEFVKESNAKQTKRASLEWSYARVEGQDFINACMKNIASALESAGVQAIIPSQDPRFGMTGIVSNWSERHVAFISGLGTFGMSRGLITKKGMAGRFGSIVISQKLEPDVREYKDVYEYCIKCGLCAKRCPANAFDKETGLKSNALCGPFVVKSKEYLSPRYGCGLCQTKVPCQDGIPKK